MKTLFFISGGWLRTVVDQVLLWIYGGGFWGGTTTLDLYDLRTIVSEENIIAVGIVTVIRIMIMIWPIKKMIMMTQS